MSISCFVETLAQNISCVSSDGCGGGGGGGGDGGDVGCESF